MPALPRFALMSMTALAMGLGHMQNVSAHGVESTLRYLDGQLELNSSFSTGEPVEGAVVRLPKLMAAQAQCSVEWTPGRLQVNLPDLTDGLVDLQVDGGPGHRDYLTLPLNRDG